MNQVLQKKHEVLAKEIAAAAKAQLGIDIDKKKLNLQEPIRMVGMAIVPYKVHPKVMGELTVKVEEA
jgi:large subunit ribosomal protein L9